jgi:hypothetical protein
LRVFFPGGASTRDYGKKPKIIVSRCTACDREAVFINDLLLVPDQSQAPLPVDDLPSELRDDFEEARAILNRSPRGSAALLRLVVQKLLPYLGATKSGIDAAIGELVKSGKIKSQIQKALDTVRVIGNESVHPGSMNMKDDHETAITLFRIINLIVETEITEPKRLDALYHSLPTSKLTGIAKRDAP